MNSDFPEDISAIEDEEIADGSEETIGTNNRLERFGDKRVLVSAIGAVCLLLLTVVIFVIFVVPRFITTMAGVTPEPTLIPVIEAPKQTATPGEPTAIPPTNVPPTPLPTETPLPEPIIVQVTGPEVIPGGLPSYIEWTVEILEGDMTVATLNSLGGALLEADIAGDAHVERILALGSMTTESEWVISGVLDPNMGGGIFKLLVSSADGSISKTVSLPWQVMDTTMVQYSSATFTIDSNNIVTDSDEVAVDTESLQPDRQVYTGKISFEYPVGWVVNNSLDVVAVASNNHLLSAVPGPDTESGAYLEFAIGTPAELGLLNAEFDGNTTLFDTFLQTGGTDIFGEAAVDARPLTLSGGETGVYATFSVVDELTGPAQGLVVIAGDDETVFIAIGTIFEKEGEESTVTIDEMMSIIESVKISHSSQGELRGNN